MRVHFSGKFAVGIAFGFALMLLSSSCGPSTPPDTRAADEKTIRDLDAKWAQAAMAGDLDTTVSYYSDDASLLPPNAPAANSKDGIRTLWKSLLTPGSVVSWKPTKVDVARSGELAYLVGTYQVGTKEPAKTVDTGKMVEVWKKQADGNWKVVADIFNSDLAAPAAAPAPTHARAPKKKKGRK
jgi:uncharacterized protein (TIGR02246 family)